MKILEIYIYGYGKLENKKISNVNDFQIFYGENEAGKSTIMSFIHSILFGFPVKQQAEVRYEPKKSAKYGGRLTVLFNNEKRAVIERVKGRAAGDVSVFLDDGTLGGEDLLKELLSYMDKNIFQSIFSFNLHGLQNVHQLKSEDLGKFLFSAGTLGSDRLLTAEINLQKEMDARFKPNGKKPSINEKLKELRQLHGNLKKAEQQNEQYWELLKERDLQQNQIVRLDNETEILKKKYSRLEEWKRMLPVINEQASLQEEISLYENIAFPVDGFKRLERIEQNIQIRESQMKSISEKIELLEKELAELTPNVELIKSETEILSAVEKLPLYEQLKTEENQLRLNIAKVKEEILLLEEQLHLPGGEEWLEGMNTSVFMKEKAAGLQAKQQRIRERQQELDLRFSEEKDALEAIEKTMKEVQIQLLSEEERKRLEEQAAFAEQKHSYEKEMEDIQEKLSFYKKTLQTERKNREQVLFQQIFFIFLVLALAGWGIWNNQWIIAAGGSLLLLFQIAMILKVRDLHSVKEIEEQADALRAREKKLIALINGPDALNLSFIKEKLARDIHFQEQFRALQIRWQQQNGQYEKILSAFEKWEQESAEFEKQFIELRKELRLPQNLGSKLILNAFELIVALKLNYREKAHLYERLHMVEAALENMERHIFSLAEALLGASRLNIQEAAFLLRNSLKAESGKQIQFNEKRTKLEELQDELRTVSVEHRHYKNEVEKLLSLTDAKTAEEFRELGLMADKKERLTSQLDTLERQLKFTAITAAEKKQLSMIDPEDEINRISKRLEQIDADLPSLREKNADLKHQISILENGGTYSDLLHRYTLMKSEFEDDAKEWARFAVAQDLLVKTVERYKNKRLPKMLAKAEEYLFHLTNGNYIRIHPQKTGSGFLIEDCDHTLFEANELSQATAEQIYVALRLALAATLYKEYHFPIIIDDSFVNFDEKRTERVISLIKNLSGQQILFFTCHKHLLSYFEQPQILKLGTEDKAPVQL